MRLQGGSEREKEKHAPRGRQTRKRNGRMCARRPPGRRRRGETRHHGKATWDRESHYIICGAGQPANCRYRSRTWQGKRRGIAHAPVEFIETVVRKAASSIKIKQTPISGKSNYKLALLRLLLALC